MRISKKLIGKLVKVAFMDHAIGTKSSILCTAIGQVVKVDKRDIVLRYWHCTDDSMDNDHNNEHIVIVKSTVLEIKVLK
jgi:hypothetical protein